MNTYDKSTAAGQTRLFYEVQTQVAETMHEKMARIAYERGYADAQAGTLSEHLTGNADYMLGHSHGAINPTIP